MPLLLSWRSFNAVLFFLRGAPSHHCISTPARLRTKRMRASCLVTKQCRAIENGASLSSRRPIGGGYSAVNLKTILVLHDSFDESKAHLAHFRHRALRHHSEGIFMCASIFGATIRNSDGKDVPVRTVGEQHVTDDLRWIPSVKDWLQHIQPQPWMGTLPSRPQTDAAPAQTNAVHFSNGARPELDHQP